jgi:hypothetical protein
MNRDPLVVDVQAEIAHWQARHAQGNLGIGKFSELSPVVKMACDVYLQAPHSSDQERLAMFRRRIEHHFISSSTQEHYEQLATGCWERLSRRAS